MDLPDTLAKKVAEYFTPLLVEEMKKKEHPKFELLRFDRFESTIRFIIRTSQKTNFQIRARATSNLGIAYMWIFLQIHYNIQPKLSLYTFLLPHCEGNEGNLYYDYCNNELIYRCFLTRGDENCQITHRCIITNELHATIDKYVDQFRDILRISLLREPKYINKEKMNVSTIPF